MSDPSQSVAVERVGFRALFRVVLEKELIILRRYWIDTLGGFGATYIMFLLFFLGGQSTVPALVEDNLTGIIVGFLVWTMSWNSFQSSAQTLSREARWGTLEQTYMSPFGLFAVISVRLLVQVGYTLCLGLSMLLLVMATTGQWLLFDPLTVLPLTVMTMLSATGLGYAFGGLALVYKRVSNIFIIVQFLLLGAIGSPSTPLTNLLPLAWGTDLLVTVITHGMSLWRLPIADLLGVSAVTAGYLLLGYLAFKYAIGVTQRRGTIGHY